MIPGRKIGKNGFLELMNKEEILEQTRQPLKIGDKISANPIVHAVGKLTGCVDPKTNQLKPESGCGKMKNRLNAGMSITEAMKLRLQGK